MTVTEVNECLQIFYAAVRQKDGKQFKVSSLRSIRAAIDRYLRQPPINKPWSIVGDKEFNTANKILNAICKKNAKEGTVGNVVHKQPINKEQIQHLFETGQLGTHDTTDPATLLRTAWFYLTLYFGKRGRENQRKLTKNMLILRTTPQGRRYYELNSSLSSKNHQGGLNDNTDESDGKMFEVKDSARCPVKTIEKYIQHLNPELEALFQRSREACAKFQPNIDPVWYCNSPIGQSTLDNMMKTMSKAAEISPHLTNHCVRATSVTVLADNNVEARHIKAVTGHKSTNSIESYNSRSSLQQKENMSNILSHFVAEDNDCQLAIQHPSSSSSTTCEIIPSNGEKPQNLRFQAPQALYFHACEVSITNNNYLR